MKLDLPRPLSYWLSRFDTAQYAKDFILPANMPPKLRQFILSLKNDLEKNYTENQIKAESRYQALQSQINPHFLYNTLECIRSEAICNGCFEVANMTETLSRYFRYNISVREDIVTLQEELLGLNDYFAIQKYRFGDRYRLEVVIEDDTILHSLLPKITLQPIVENALLHGLAGKENGGTVTIRAAQSDTKVYLWISDDGVGMSQDTLLQLNQKLQKGEPEKSANSIHVGIAMTNVNARIKLYFGDEYGLRINSIKNMGTDVELVYPLHIA